MKSKDDLIGKLARLPNDEIVRIEKVYDDGQARARRVEGERKGTIAVCDIKSLSSPSGSR